jgi:hypothetical protein
MTARGAGTAVTTHPVVWQAHIDGGMRASLGSFRLAVVRRPSGVVEWSVMARGFVPGLGYRIEYDSADVDDFEAGMGRAEEAARRMLEGRCQHGVVTGA